MSSEKLNALTLLDLLGYLKETSGQLGFKVYRAELASGNGAYISLNNLANWEETVNAMIRKLNSLLEEKIIDTQQSISQP